MGYFKSAVSALALVAGMSPVQAADVSAAGATALLSTFESYFGKNLQSVRITPNAANDGYDIAIDASKVLKPLETHGITIKPMMFNFVVKPLADGNWQVIQNSMPVIDMTAPDGGFKIASEGTTFSGLWNPKLAALMSGEGAVKKMTMSGEDKDSKFTADVANATIKVTSTDAGGGAVNQKFEEQLGTLVEVITPKTDSVPPVKMSIAKSVVVGEATGLMSRAMLDLWATIAANAGSHDKLVAAQDDLKKKVAAALPLWKNANFGFVMNDLVVETPQGNVKFPRMELTESVTGIVRDGVFSFGIHSGGVEVPAKLVPEWAVKLTPKDTVFNVKVSGYDLETLTKTVLENFDASRGKDKEISLSESEILGVLLPSAELTIGVPGGKIAGDGYEVVWDGQGTVSPITGQGEGKVVVKAKGLDSVASKLSAAKDPNAAQAVGGIYAAKAMAKAVDGMDVWEIEFDSFGKLTVNGQNLGG